MKHNFTIRIYQDNYRSELSDLRSITISDITIISKSDKYGGLCFHKGNQKKFGYSLELSKNFNHVSGSHRYPTLSFKGDYLDITVRNFPRYPAFYQDKYAAKGCLGGYGYTNYLNKGFPKQLNYRTIEFTNL